MRGHIIAEERFLHQGIDHHLFVTGIETAEHEYRFELRRLTPGDEHAATGFEKTVDFSTLLSQCPGTTIDQLITAELMAIKTAIRADEARLSHAP